jgi:Skp family chaperone for outer membrane proteins
MNSVRVHRSQIRKECQIVNTRVFSKLLFAVCAWTSLVVSGSAQQTPVAAPAAAAAAPSNPIGVIDMAIIFKDCQQYQDALTTLKNQATAEEQKLKAEFESMKAKASKLQALTPGSQEFRTLEAELSKLDIDLKYKAQMARRDFEDRVNGVQYNLYKQVDTCVKAIAQANNFGLVLRHSTAQIKGENPQEVARALTQQVIYYNPRYDITGMVLTMLKSSNQPLMPAGMAGRPGTAPAVPR